MSERPYFYVLIFVALLKMLFEINVFIYLEIFFVSFLLKYKQHCSLLKTAKPP